MNAAARTQLACQMKTLYQKYQSMLWVYGFKILCEISKVSFEISHKIWTRTLKICILRGIIWRIMLS